MPYKKESQLSVLIKSLSPGELRQVKKHFKETGRSNKSEKQNILKKILKSDPLDLEIRNKGIEKSKFRNIKFQMFTEVVNLLIRNISYNREDLFSVNQLKFEILVKKGLFTKAHQILCNTVELAFQSCKFDVCYRMQLSALDYGLFKKIGKEVDKSKVRNDLKLYYELSHNLNSYLILSEEVFQAHYEYLDSRVENKSKLLDYLKHPLIKENSASSILSEFYFHRINSFIYLGNNDYLKSRECSLQAYNTLLENKSHFRNDNLNLLRSVNNYLDASLNMEAIEDYKKFYPKFLELCKQETAKSNLHFDLIVFQFKASLTLNYFWIQKDIIAFDQVMDEYELQFYQFENKIEANLQLEILLGLARMYFLKTNYTKANMLTDEIINKKSNPTSLFIVCASLLRIMINYDLGNLKLIPHLIRTSKYHFKNRNRLFDLEKSILNGFNKLKLYKSKQENQKVLHAIYLEVNNIMLSSGELVIDRNINIMAWLKDRSGL